MVFFYFAEPILLSFLFIWLAFEQDLTDLMVELPRLPADLPFVVLQTQDGRKPKLNIKVRPQVLKDALNWLIKHNPWYSQYTINEDNMAIYEANPVITEQDLRSIVQDWEPTPQENEPQFHAMGEKDVIYEEDLSGDFPNPDGCVMTEVPSNTNEGIIKESLANATSSATESGQNIPSETETIVQESPDDQPSSPSSEPNEPSQPESNTPADIQPEEDLQQRPTLAWPRKSKKPLSEFEPGYFAKCFPHLLPDGTGDFLMPVS